MKNVIFIAPPAAGKGTLSDFLKEKYQYEHISTGDLIRDKIKQNDEEGQSLAKTIQAGHLVDDNMVFHLLEEKLSKIKQNKNFILDGIPRTLQQAMKLDIILRDLDFSDYIVIDVDVEENILKKRVTGRRICSNCKSAYNIYFEKFKPQQENLCDKCGHELEMRSDDNEETFKVRYETFKKNNEQIIEYYQNQGKLYVLDNSQEDQTNILNKLDRIVGAKVD